jgi:hypothetical protein
MVSFQKWLLTKSIFALLFHVKGSLMSPFPCLECSLELSLYLNYSSIVFLALFIEGNHHFVSSNISTFTDNDTLWVFDLKTEYLVFHFPHQSISSHLVVGYHYCSSIEWFHSMFEFILFIYTITLVPIFLKDGLPRI